MVLNKEKMIPVVSLILAMLLWGGSFIALKIAFRYYDPMVVIFGRMLVACLCFIFFMKRLLTIQYKKGDWKYILLMGLFEPCLYFMFEAKAITNTSASQAGMITAMLPLLVALAAWIFLKEDIHVRTILGFALAVAGACLLSITGPSSVDAPNPPLGNFFEFMAMVSATCYAIVLKKLSMRYSALFLTAIQALIGALFFSIFLFFPSTTIPAQVEPQGMYAILYLGAVVTMGAYFLYNYGVSQMPASRATAFVNLIPIFTVFMGWLILGEAFTTMQFVSAGVILAGVFLSQS
ncbi:MAG: DMT family transporter [Proteobacteria bacterium]|nr:DMT family transporter [Pseudomonadota bacterium]